MDSILPFFSFMHFDISRHETVHFLTYETHIVNVIVEAEDPARSSIRPDIVFLAAFGPRRKTSVLSVVSKRKLRERT